MAKECDKPRDMSKVQCRNCDDYGHTSRECPKPRDCKSRFSWPRIPHADIVPDSRVQCQNCQEFGHTKVRCTKPHVDEDGGAGADGGGFDPVDISADGGAGGDDWNNGPSGGGW